MKYYENKEFYNLLEKFVKPVGKSDTVAGELIRAVNRICYRFFNDLDMIGCGYGNETCNAAGRFILVHGNIEMKKIINTMWDGKIHDTEYNNLQSDEYELLLTQLTNEVVKYIKSDDDKLKIDTPDLFDYVYSVDDEYDIEQD